MTDISMKQLLEAGVHFGHQTSRWNPKMKPYIFGARNGIHIIDLQQTVRMVKDVCAQVRDLIVAGGHVLFVGTKKQAQDSVREEAERCGMSYVHHRWLGGTLTNFQTVRQSIERLKKLEEMANDPKVVEALTKKEMLSHSRERAKLERALGGIKEIKKLPDAVFIIDPGQEGIAVREGAQARHQGDRDHRHGLRPGSGGLQDPRQRRCDSRHPAFFAASWPRPSMKARRYRTRRSWRRNSRGPRPLRQRRRQQRRQPGTNRR